MKIVDAFWEKRNLDLKSCYEINIDVTDNVVEVEKALSGISAQYTVVKIPACRLDLSQLLGSLGFNYVESLLHCTLDLTSTGQIVKGIAKRLLDRTSCEEMRDDDIVTLFEEIKGNIFETDRIILDSHFTKEQAANRYIYWIKDELERGSKAYKMLYKGKSVAFFTLKDLGSGVFYPFLAGVYREWLNKGFGFCLTHHIAKAIRKNGGHKISTYISSNNLAVFRKLVEVRYKFDNVYYVFVKHSEGR